MQEEWKVCPYCKPSQNAVCSNCGKELQKEWEVCPYCSKPVAKTEYHVLPITVLTGILYAIAFICSIIAIMSDDYSNEFPVGMVPIILFGGWLIITVAGVLFSQGQTKNSRKMLLSAVIVYLCGLFCFYPIIHWWVLVLSASCIPSAVLCFIAYAKRKKSDKVKS